MNEDEEDVGAPTPDEGPRFRSLLDELTDFVPTRERNRNLFVESRAEQVMSSAIHLLRLIRESYDENTAEDLTGRLLRAIRAGEKEKFHRKIRQIREGRGR